MAGMILKEDVEKVRAAADLYDIVSATVTLKPSGTGTFVGLCPFHDEKTPSFIYNKKHEEAAALQSSFYSYFQELRSKLE